MGTDRERERQRERQTDREREREHAAGGVPEAAKLQRDGEMTQI